MVPAAVKPRAAARPNTAARHCWECKKRRLTCDSSLPGCKRCWTAGLTCPGYGDTRPLRWLAPGQVVSSTKRSKPKPGGAVRDNSRSITPRFDIKLCADYLSKDDRFSTAQATIYNIQCILPNMIVPEGSDLLAPYTHPGPSIVQGVLTWPQSSQQLIIVAALAHRIFKQPADTGRSVLSGYWSRLYQHRQKALSALNSELDSNPLASIRSIEQFLEIDIYYHTGSSPWRWHLYGLTRLIMLHGGVSKLLKITPHIKNCLTLSILYEMLGNTTTSSSEQVQVLSGIKMIGTMEEIWADNFLYAPNFLCPKPLFFILIQINHLRGHHRRGSSRQLSSSLVLLESIVAFSPQDWAACSPITASIWELVGKLYQSVIAIYCIGSLQGLGLLPATSEMDELRTTYADRAFALLRGDLPQQWRFSTSWPLVIAGVEAKRRSQVDRSFVASQLKELSQIMGAGALWSALSVLESFWHSDKKTWDECFATPCCFLL